MIIVYIIGISILILFAFIAFILIRLYFKNREQNSSHYIEKQLKTILDTMNQAILLFNKEGKLLFYNDDAKHLLNLNTSFVNNAYETIFENEKIRTAIKTLSVDTSFDLVENNKIYAVNIYSVKEKLHKKEEISVIVILKNVTERRTVEQTKKDFFSHASHELKSPLTAIVGYSELVALDMVEKEEYSDIFSRIYKQAMHMTLLVDEMSTLSRLEAIPADENQLMINLGLILRETIDTLEPFIIEKNISVDLEIEQIIYRALSLDMNKLFKNLIENAIKYSPANTEIMIKLYSEEDKIFFVIKDQGMGIAIEHQQRIFERFYRVDKGRLDSGTGLGLAIVKHIVIKYSGKIYLESEITKGTKITIELNKN